MQNYEDEAIVLRTHKLGEADRIITLLGRAHGKIRAVAKGVRKPTTRFGGRLEPFMVVGAQFRRGRNLDIVVGVDTRRAYADPISRDYSRYTAGSVILETADRLTGADTGGGADQYTLLRGAIGSLARGDHAPELIRDSYILRALAVGGWAPQFDVCVQCGADAPLTHISLALGGTLCADCAIPGNTAVEPETPPLLAALLSGEWGHVDASAAFPRAEAAGIVAAYLQHVLERRVASLTIGHTA